MPVRDLYIRQTKFVVWPNITVNIVNMISPTLTYVGLSGIVNVRDTIKHERQSIQVQIDTSAVTAIIVDRSASSRLPGTRPPCRHSCTQLRSID